MTSFVIDDLATTPQSLAASETGLITANGTLASTPTANPISMTGDSSLVIAGSVITSGLFTGIYGANLSDATVTITSTGYLSGNTAFLTLFTDTLTVTNAGMIDAESSGIVFIPQASDTDEEISILNSGTIYSREGSNISGNVIDGHATVTNTGTIQSGSSTANGAITFNGIGSGTATLINSGLISSLSSNTPTIRLFTVDTTIINSGTIDGGILSEDSRLHLTNTGTITGDVTGDGLDDTFDLGTGTVTGTVFGGEGDDTYHVDAAARISETTGTGGGTDTVHASITWSLGLNFEDLVLTGTGDIAGNGNAGENTITGNDGDNILRGRSGADILDGSDGDDTLIGGTGDDTYVFGDGDVYIDVSGIDTLVSDTSTTLGATIEKLVLTGTSAASGTGNTLANTLTGNASNNSLNGLTGLDRLTGGDGGDTFVFTTTLGTTNIDTITDFNSAADTIAIDNAVFAGLVNGTLAASAFVSNLTGNAADASDRIIYESDTGKLFFDRDGTGAAAKVQFATLTTNLLIGSADFFVI